MLGSNDAKIDLFYLIVVSAQMEVNGDVFDDVEDDITSNDNEESPSS